MRAILESLYPPEERYLPETPAPLFLQEFLRLPAAERARLRCIGGHLYYGLHEHLVQTSCYLTLLRDPIERMVSLYYYCRRRPDLPLHGDAMRLSLTGFLRRATPSAGNVQTRFLSGVGRTPSP